MIPDAATRGRAGAGARAAALAAIGFGLVLCVFPAAKLLLQRTNEAMHAIASIRMLEAGDFLAWLRATLDDRTSSIW